VFRFDEHHSKAVAVMGMLDDLQREREAREDDEGEK